MSPNWFVAASCGQIIGGLFFFVENHFRGLLKMMFEEAISILWFLSECKLVRLSVLVFLDGKCIHGDKPSRLDNGTFIKTREPWMAPSPVKRPLSQHGKKKKSDCIPSHAPICHQDWCSIQTLAPPQNGTPPWYERHLTASFMEMSPVGFFCCCFFYLADKQANGDENTTARAGWNADDTKLETTRGKNEQLWMPPHTRTHPTHPHLDNCGQMSTPQTKDHCPPDTPPPPSPHHPLLLIETNGGIDTSWWEGENRLRLLKGQEVLPW